MSFLRALPVVFLLLAAACWQDSSDDQASENERPIAVAGADRTVRLGERVALNGSGSSGRTASLLRYSWSFVRVPDGSFADISDPDRVNPHFVAGRLGEYAVALVVHDGEQMEELHIVSWDALHAACADLMQAVPGAYPERYRVTGFPDLALARTLALPAQA